MKLGEMTMSSVARSEAVLPKKDASNMANTTVRIPKEAAK
jgi:hypothetical protein